ncbi:hypothetical protein EJD97_022133, partial [Solanum chilense]
RKSKSSVNTSDALESDDLRILKHVTMMEDIDHGLLKCGRIFLWVIREGQGGVKMEDNLKSIASKVPNVACPLWNNQVCNAKLIQDIWKNGVRVNISEGGVVKRDEFNRCITIVMRDDEEGKELRRNIKNWSDLAKEAMKKNSTSNVNLKTFGNEILLGHNEY